MYISDRVFRILDVWDVFRALSAIPATKAVASGRPCVPSIAVLAE